MINPIFHSVTLDQGGELDKADASRPEQEAITYFESCLEAMDKPDLYIGLINNSDFNATVFQRYKSTYIGLYSGAIRKLVMACFSLFSHQDAFLDFGSPKSEAADIDLSRGISRITSFKVPKTKERKVFASAVLQLSTSFLFCHELGHIWKGHINYLSNRNCKFFEASSPSSSVPLTPLTLQAIELDADQSAAYFSIICLNDVSTFLGNKMDAFRAWVLALYVVYMILAESSGSFSTFEGNTHPHPWIRLSFSRTHAIYYVSEWLDQPQNTIESLFLETISEIKETWIRLKIPGYKLLLNKASMRAKTLKVLYRLSHELADLNDQGISKMRYPKPSPDELSDALS